MARITFENVTKRFGDTLAVDESLNGKYLSDINGL